jgi:hypothetical protein
MSVCRIWIDGRYLASDVPKKKEDFFAGEGVAENWIIEDLRSNTSSRCCACIDLLSDRFG